MSEVQQQEEAKGATTKSPLDFTKVDALRKRMLLTIDSMCVLLDVSRVSYHNWLSGKSKPRNKRDEQIRATLRKLIWCITEKQWPTPEVLVADQKDRLALLQEMLAKHS